MRSLYSTFVVVTLGVMVVSGVFAFLLANSYYQQVLKPQNDEKYTEISLDVAAYIEAQEGIILDDHLELIANMGYQLKIVDEEGSSAFYGQPFREKSLGESTVSSVLAGETYHGIAMFPSETFVTGFFANELQNSIGVPVHHNGERYALFLRPDLTLHFNEMRFLFAWLLGLTIVFSLIFELILAKYLIKPLSELNKATKDVGEGNFDLSFDFKRKDEIGELATSFQDMSNQLAQVENMRHEFISNVSHDIQSPLSNINGYTELLESSDLTTEQKKEYLEVIREETNRLSSLTSQLLVLSSLNQLTDLRGKEEFSLSEQITSLIKKYQWQLFDKEITLQYSLPDTVYTGDPSLLISVWDNLLSNAVKYNQQGGSILIELQEEEHYIDVVFQDTGIGLTSEQKENIFERFYRADTSRTKEVGGTGLGLAIAAKIVALHDGEIQVDSEKNQGTTFTIKLPKDSSFGA